jgi:CO/xanthine dehydrogenase Mo-binding subunit
MKAFRTIGASIPRHDVVDKACGTQLYTADKVMFKQLYGALVISERAHAEVIDIDVSKAVSIAGVIKIYTPQDVPRDLYSTYVWMPGLKDIEDESVLTMIPKHHGDRIACVVAESEQIARIAAKAIKLTYRDLPVIKNIDDAIAPDSFPIHTYGNSPFKAVKAYGEVDEAFAEAPVIVEDIVSTPAQHHGAIENHACLAYMDNGVLTLETPCQITFQVQLLVSQILKLPESKVRVIKMTTGGSFGGKSQPILEVLTAFIAYDLRRPISIQTDRQQSILSTRRRNGVRANVKLAMNQDGYILSRDMDIIVDTGAYYGNGTAVAMAMMKKSFRLYRIKSQRYAAQVVVTNTPVAGAIRGYGSPQIHALTEINMENAAREIQMDPLDLRLKNLVTTEDIDPIGGPSLGNVGITDCLIQGAKSFGWREAYERPRDQGRFRRGVGLAAIVHGNGYFGAYPEFNSIQISLQRDGGFLVNSSLHDLGCGTVTVTQQIFAEALNTEVQYIQVMEADTLRSLYDPSGTQACRVTFVCGETARLCAEEMKRKILEVAQELTQKSLSDLHLLNQEIVDGEGNAIMTLKELSTQCIQKLRKSLTVILDYEATGNPGSYGANFAEVEVDTWTGLVKVIRITAAHDIGKAINLGFVRGQINGGIQMNLGFALCEEMLLNKDGTIKSNSFSRYHMINAPAMPPVDMVLIENGEPNGPYGAKSIGEACSVATAPAVVNAINHALGTRITTLPVTPERIIQALSTQ